MGGGCPKYRTEGGNPNAGHRKRLKERYRAAGMEALSDHEALELLLMYAIPRKDVKPQAKQLLERFRSYEGVWEAGMDELCRVEGVGPDTALLFQLVRDLMSRYFRGRARRRPQIRGTEDLIRYCRLEMGHLKEEQFRVIYLNTRNCIIRDEVLQEGTVDRAEVYPRKILERALQYKASAMILVHNHPGGSLRPSPQDVKLTERVVRSARELDMVVHDHMIVAGEGVFSFREEGLLPVK